MVATNGAGRATRRAALLLSIKLLAAEERVRELEAENASLKRHEEVLAAALTTIQVTTVSDAVDHLRVGQVNRQALTGASDCGCADRLLAHFAAAPAAAV